MFSYDIKKAVKLVLKMMHLALLIPLLKTALNDIKCCQKLLLSCQKLLLKVLLPIFNDICLRLQDHIRITVKMS